VLAQRLGLADLDRVKNLRAFLTMFAFAALFSVAVRAELAWSTDYKQAQEEAKANHKLLLLNFTGSDWCGWCQRLKREVFSQPAFADYATKNLVLMEVDFPRRKQLTDAVRQQNETMAEAYHIEGFPTIIVLNSEGQKIGELNYLKGGPDAFIAELEKLRKG
jgi:thioredoxin-related protein